MLIEQDLQLQILMQIWCIFMLTTHSQPKQAYVLQEYVEELALGALCITVYEVKPV